MKKLMIVAVAALLGLSWWTTFSSAVQKPAEYQSYLAEAQKNEKKGIYYDAILNYQKALEYHPENMDIYLKIAEAYKNLGDENGFIQACTQAMNLEGDGEQAVMILADYYLEKGQKGDAIALLQAQIQQQESNGSLRAKLNSLAGGFDYIGEEYDEISNACGSCMLVKSGEDLGITDLQGNVVIRAQYEQMGMFGENGFAPVQKDGTWYYIDTNNYKRRQPDEEYEFLGVCNQGAIPAKKDGKWGYLNEDFQPVTKFEYDGATPFLNGLAALKKGEKWAIINTELKAVTDLGFDDIVCDDWGFCSRNGVVFAKIGEKYYLINSEGVQIGDEYDAVSPFLSSGPAAVMQAGKWGFVSSKGDQVLKCMFENASAFSELGYAPVCSGGKWGFIKENGDFVVEPQFEGAKTFNKEGAAPVKENGKWKLIQLDIY